MAETLSLPVLPLDDNVVLPSMVVPLDLSAAEPRAAIEAAQLAAAAAGGDAKAQLLLVPRPDGKYIQIGTLATIEQVGRLPSGERAAVVRGTARVLIGTGTVGPGQALWVEGTGRLHDRARWTRSLSVGSGVYQGGSWHATRLQP